MRSAFTCVILLLAIPFAFGQLPAEGTGSICGSVLDENGAPASHVKVFAVHWDPGGHGGGLPGIETDSAGHYCVSHLRLGDYIMSAFDRKNGYPLWGIGFYAWDYPAPKVTLTAYNPDAHLDWRIPFKAGFLTVHVSVDQSDLRTIPISIHLVAPSRPAVGFEGDEFSLKTDQTSSSTLLVPPGEDVRLTATSPGYLPWPEAGSPGELINVRAGETEEISIQLIKEMP